MPGVVQKKRTSPAGQRTPLPLRRAPPLAAGTALRARASARSLAQSRPAARHPLAVRVRRVAAVANLGGEELHDALGAGKLPRPLRVVAASVAREDTEADVCGAAVPDVADSAANADGAPRPLAAVEAQPAGVQRRRADAAAAPGPDAAAAGRPALTAAAELDSTVRLAVVHRDRDWRGRIELVLVPTDRGDMGRYGEIWADLGRGAARTFADGTPPRFG
mmetsp:Transcript_45002/g.149148  ORF Transcript_45002/g.149148 Transcript_45002/m.149148 type:complete len:220 (+) Transcript_45002:82-741(+)